MEVEAIDDEWDAVLSTITLDATRFTPQALAGLEDFSHVEVAHLLDRVDPAGVQDGSRHPRGNPARPSVGISPRARRTAPTASRSAS